MLFCPTLLEIVLHRAPSLLYTAKNCVTLNPRLPYTFKNCVTLSPFLDLHC